MDHVNPSLELTFCLQQAALSGQGLKSGLSAYLKRCRNDDPLSLAAMRLMNHRESGQERREPPRLSPYQLALLDLLRRGLDGESVGLHLEQLRKEIELSLQREIERHVCLVPFWSFLPLVIFQLPAILMLALFPLLRELLEQLSSS